MFLLPLHKINRTQEAQSKLCFLLSALSFVTNKPTKMETKTFITTTLLLGLCLSANTQSESKKPKSATENAAINVVIREPGSVADDLVATDTVATPVPEEPKDRTDTIYYDKQWRVISNKTFASYYRYALYPADPTATKYFKTFYANGALQGEGIFIDLDSHNDTKSVFDGEIQNYYANGALKEKLNYTNGKPNGEHTIYYENGNIKEHTTLENGKKAGIVSSFTEDGRVCRLQEHAADVPSNFYVVVDMDGNYSKYDAATDSPIFEKPSLDEAKTEYKNGVAWPYYNKNGLIVGISNSVIKEEIGDVREIGVFLVNKSMINVEIDPANIEVYYVKKGKRTDMEIMSADDYDKKIYKKKVKNAKKQLKQKAVVTIEREDNVNENLGASVFDAGASNTLKRFQERIVKLKKLAGENRMRYANREHEDLGYLERTTVHPGEVVSGFLYTDDKKVDDLFVKVCVNGIDYLYEWKADKKK